MIGALLYPAKKRALQSLFSDTDVQLPDISYSEEIMVTASIIDAVGGSLTSTRIWEPQSLTGWTLRAGIGNGFTPPTAGSFKLVFTAADTTTETTAPIAFDANASTVAGALNAGAKMTAAGGCTVSGSAGYFFVTFNTAGDRAQIVGDATNLAPQSVVETSTLVNGASGIQEVQSFRLIQLPAAYAALTVVSAVASSSVTLLQVGDGTHNHKIRIKQTPIPYDGQWTITVGGNETDFISFDATETDVTTAIEALASVGAGNVSVSKELAGQWLIMFIGAKANTNMGTITSDPSGLKVVDARSGVLETFTAAMEELLGANPTADGVSTFFEIEGTDPGGNRQKLYKVPCKVVAPVITSTAVAPTPFVHFYTATEIDSMMAAKVDKLNTSWKFYDLPTQQADIKSGTTFNFLSGSTASFAGSLGGTPTGGTFNLSNVTLTLPNSCVSEGKLSLSDVTTANVTTGHHGLIPKLPNDSTKFLNGVGSWVVVSGGGGSTIDLGDIAYVTLDGDDGSAVVGDPGHPFSTFDAALTSGALIFVLGVGVTATNTTPFSGGTITIIGFDNQSTQCNLTISGDVTIYSNNLVNLGVVASGAFNGDGGAGAADSNGNPGSDGGNGYNVTIWNAYINTLGVNASGGHGGAGGMGGTPSSDGSGFQGGQGGQGGTGGIIYLYYCQVYGSINYSGGDGGNGGQGSAAVSSEFAYTGGNGGNGGNAGGASEAHYYHCWVYSSSYPYGGSGSPGSGGAGGIGAGSGGDGTPGAGGSGGSDGTVTMVLTSTTNLVGAGSYVLRGVFQEGSTFTDNYP